MIFKIQSDNTLLTAPVLMEWLVKDNPIEYKRREHLKHTCTMLTIHIQFRNVNHEQFDRQNGRYPIATVATARGSFIWNDQYRKFFTGRNQWHRQRHDSDITKIPVRTGRDVVNNTHALVRRCACKGLGDLAIPRNDTREKLFLHSCVTDTLFKDVFGQLTETIVKIKRLSFFMRD